MRKAIEGYIEKLEHERIVSELNAEWRKSIEKIVKTLKDRYSDHLYVKTTIIHHDPPEHITVSEWRAGLKDKIE